jgi:hypothetical protein
MGGIFQHLGSVTGAVYAAVLFIVLSAIFMVVKITKLPIMVIINNVLKKVLTFIGKLINKREEAYHRDLEIGKINEQRASFKVYSFLNDLLIDLNLLRQGYTPYELAFVVSFITLVATLILCKMLLGTFLIAIIMFPIALAGVFCVLYTRANIAHDTRIENVIEAENIICNNIKVGVLVAVRESIDVLPKELRPTFKDFIDNVEQKNYHIKTALLELNRNLGSVADDFIKKCIVFEMEEEHGIAGMFSDIVEINNINLEMRTEMKREFEQVKYEFKIGAGMIFAFLAGVLFIFPDVRTWYLSTWIGQGVLAIDILLLIVEYVYLTYLRAKEL